MKAGLLDGISSPVNAHPPKIELRVTQIVLVIAFLGLTFATWQMWGGLIADCGREMYVPEALTRGEQLYIDVWYPYGPLAPYLNSWLFRLFGVHLNVLYGAGLTATAITTAVLFSISRQVLPITLAGAAALAFLLQAFHWSIFCYILPYSYASVYGVLLCTLLLRVAITGTRSARHSSVIWGGVLCGLTLLSKTEFGFASCVILITCLALRSYRYRSKRGAVLDLLSTAPGFLLCAAIYGWFALPRGLGFLIEENFMSLPGTYFMRTYGRLWLESVGLTFSPFVLATGLLRALLCLCVWYAAVRACVLCLSNRRLMIGAAILSFCIAVILLGQRGNVRQFVVSFALFTLYPASMFWMSALLLPLAFVKRLSLDFRMLISLIGIAGVSIGWRIAAQVTPYYYPIFYNSLLYVCFLVLIACVSQRPLDHLPLTARRMGWICITMLLGVVLLTHFRSVRRTPGSTPRLLATNRGNIIVPDKVAMGYDDALAFLRQRKANKESVIVLPEDTGLYFFAEIDCPTRHHQLGPGILEPGPMTTAYNNELLAKNVDYIIVTNNSKPEYRAPFFGKDYNQEVYKMIREEYEIMGTLGTYDLQVHTSEWGALIYKRKKETAIYRAAVQDPSAPALRTAAAASIPHRSAQYTRPEYPRR